ncbi:MAG: glycosyltransferase family 4 protein [Acidobacteriota bacterium]|nr:glycosyltransferase family 4 protein [Acidobacteriota bacterium]
MAQENKPKILIFCDFYLPGYKSGGGMRTLVNMVDRLGEKFDFRIVTRDHDGKTDKTQYKNVKINDWNEVGNAKVYYLSRDNIKLKAVKKLIEEVEPKSIYVNSFFSTLTVFVLLLKKLRQIPNIAIIVAPEGELAAGALALKKSKKQLYLRFAGALGLYRNVIWKATADFEKAEIERVIGKGGRIFIAPNMPPKQIFPEFDVNNKPFKNSGELNAVYLSRLHPIKNLKFLLEILPNIKDKVYLDIFGPVDNHQYVEECEELIKKLPANLNVRMKGEVSHENVMKTLEKYNFFVLPTRGESFGHIIAEALASGCPLIISDKTPWINLEEKGIGWDLPLDNKNKWLDTLRYCISLDNDSYSNLATNARNYSNLWLADTKIEKATEDVLNYSLSKA